MNLRRVSVTRLEAKLIACISTEQINKYCTHSRPTHPSIPPWSINEDQLLLVWQVWFITVTNECVATPVRSLDNTCHTWALLQWVSPTKRHYINSVSFTLPYMVEQQQQWGQQVAALKPFAMQQLDNCSDCISRTGMLQTHCLDKNLCTTR